METESIPTRQPEMNAVIGLFLALSWIFVGLRAYVRTFITKGWAADDALLGISLVFFTLYSISAFLSIKYGNGLRFKDISQPLTNIPLALEHWWICELLYTLTTVFIRLSIAVFLLRIATRRIYKIIIYITLAVVLAFSTFFLFLVIFQCSPVNFFWEQAVTKAGTCINKRTVPDASIAHSVVSFAADWVLGLLPIALLWHVQMNFRTKASIVALLSLGLLAGIAALIRIPFIRFLAITNDFLFATADIAIWSTVEPGMGIIATSCCSLRPLFRSFYNLSFIDPLSPARLMRRQSSDSNDKNKGITATTTAIPDPTANLPRTVSMQAYYEPHPGTEIHTNLSSVSAQKPIGPWFKRLGGDGIKVQRTVQIQRLSNVDEEAGLEEGMWPENELGRVRSLKVGQSAATSRQLDEESWAQKSETKLEEPKDMF